MIIPLAPGESEWTELLDQLRLLDANCEIILVRAVVSKLALPEDGLSGPRIRQLQASRGRAPQMNAGARAAKGRWLWFLHADSRMTAETLVALNEFMSRGRSAIGYFRLAFRSDGPRLTALNALGANFRSRWLGLPFGDQGFVITAKQFQELGGFDESTAYGEDHTLIWQARQAGIPIVRFDAALQTSARKYAERGWLRTTLRHGQLTIAQAVPAWIEYLRRLHR